MAPLALALAVVLVGGCSDGETGSDGEAPTLLLLPAGHQVDMFGGVEGELEINDQGCIALGGEPVVAEAGTVVEPDGETWVVTFGDREIALGESFKGAGGSILAAQVDIEGVDECLDEGSDSVFVLRPMS